MNKYTFFSYYENEDIEGYTVICTDEKKLYYYGTTCNVGFLPDSNGFESLEDCIFQYEMEALKDE